MNGGQNKLEDLDKFINFDKRRGGGGVEWGVGVIINGDGDNVNAYKLLCHNKVTRRKEKKKFAFEQKNIFFLFLPLNEGIKMSFKFEKKFHSSLITFMLY